MDFTSIRLCNSLNKLFSKKYCFVGISNAKSILQSQIFWGWKWLCEKTTAIVRFPTKKTYWPFFFEHPKKGGKMRNLTLLLVNSLFLHPTRGICRIHSDAFATNPRNLWFERSPSRNGGRQTVPLAFQRTRGLQVNSSGDDESWILHLLVVYLKIGEDEPNFDEHIFRMGGQKPPASSRYMESSDFTCDCCNI